VYPFHDGKYEDFEPIFDHLIEVRIIEVLLDAILSPSTREEELDPEPRIRTVSTKGPQQPIPRLSSPSPRP
jgi:hypothetical protein